MRPIYFKSSSDFRKWLEKYHNKETEKWVRFYKKASGKKGMNYDEALDEALCFGWIDGLAKKYDDLSYMQRFTPRRSKSNWSKINTQHVERLMQMGKIHQSGLDAVESAKKDGRWDRAYDSPKNATVSNEFLEQLSKNAKAYIFFKTLNKTNTYAIAYRLQNAKKPETKQKKIQEIISRLERGEVFH